MVFWILPTGVLSNADPGGTSGQSYIVQERQRTARDAGLAQSHRHSGPAP